MWQSEQIIKVSKYRKKVKKKLEKWNAEAEAEGKYLRESSEVNITENLMGWEVKEGVLEREQKLTNECHVCLYAQRCDYVSSATVWTGYLTPAFRCPLRPPLKAQGRKSPPWPLNGSCFARVPLSAACWKESPWWETDVLRLLLMSRVWNTPTRAQRTERDQKREQKKGRAS